MSPIVDYTIIEKLSSMLINTKLPLKLRFRIVSTLKILEISRIKIRKSLLT